MPDIPWWRKLVAKIDEVDDDEFSEQSEDLANMLDRAFEAEQQGLTRKEGTKLLTDSLDAVKQWLCKPENVGNPAGHFLAAHLSGFLGLSPLNLADIARPGPNYLPLTMDVPSGGTFTKNDGSSTLLLPGMMTTIYLVATPSAPTLGMLVELGEDGMRNHLIESGISKPKAAKTVNEAKKVLQHTKVEITPMSLGGWLGKRYSYSMPVQTVHHYCLTWIDRHILVTATEFKSKESSLQVLESALATMRLQPSR